MLVIDFWNCDLYNCIKILMKLIYLYIGMEEKQNYDKSVIHLPRQEFFFCPNLLILCRFPYNRRVYYNDFTTFEKCSDMTKKEIVENEIFIPLYKFRNISFDFEK